MATSTAEREAQESERMVSISIPENEFKALVGLVNDLSFAEKTRKTRQEYDKEDYIPLSDAGE